MNNDNGGKRAAIYSRFSTDRQNESTIADQVRVCTEFADREGLEIVATYEDQGISGAAVGNRPGLLKMQEASLRRAFDVLICADTSRLSRSQADLNKLVDRLVAKGIRVYGLQTAYDSSRAGSKMQLGMESIISEQFREMISAKTYSALESRAKERKPTGGKSYGYDGRAIVPAQAKVVREIFEHYAAGKGMRAIAGILNKRKVPSPGSTWKRETRRASGWMCSSVRVILRNPIYKGELVWNRYQWTKDPDTGRRNCKLRPESEWIRHYFEELRIVSDDLWAQVHRRVRDKETAETGKRKRSGGGKSRFVLSGLLVCGDCGSNFVLADSRAYACSGHIGGQVCVNKTRLPRKLVEEKIVRPIYNRLLSPATVSEMAKEMQRHYRERTRIDVKAPAPKAAQELDARIVKLRGRLKSHDHPDMTAEDIQVVIERLEKQRADAIKNAQPTRRDHLNSVIAVLPQAAELFRKEIAGGLKGASLEAVARARVVLGELLGGPVKLERGPIPGSLYATFKLQRKALLEGSRVCGSGGRI